MTDDTLHEGGRRRTRRAAPADPAPAAAAPSPSARPAFGLTEGERADLQLHGVTRGAFGDGLLYADDYGIEPITPAGREKLEKHRRASMPADAGTD